MNIHYLPDRSKPFDLADHRISRPSARKVGCLRIASERDTLIEEAAAKVIAETTNGFNTRTEDFQKAVPRFKAEFARLAPDYAPVELSMALAIYLGERERQLTLLATLDRLAGRSGAEFLPRGTLRIIVQKAAEAGDEGAIEVLERELGRPFID